MQATTNGEHKEAAEAVLMAEQRIASPASGDSVEALEEALAAARTRLQERVAADIQNQHAELARLQKESERIRADSDATVATATETAQRLLHEAIEAAVKMRHEANEAAERMRQGATESADQIMREANDSAARTLSHAEELATSMLAHLREHADAFLAGATTEIDTFRRGMTSEAPHAAETEARPVPADDATVAADANAKSEEKDSPSKWLRSPLRGRGSAASSDEPVAEQRPSKDQSEAKPEPQNPGKPGEAMVTRMILRPMVGGNTRNRIKERLEGLPAVQAVKLGPVGDESFEVLVIHPREAKVKDNVLALAPDEILLKDQKVGYLEIELKDLGWVESGAAAAD